ncbi:MAG: class I SAM-dependent methyltransferase [Thermodesulfobacteriota bacterium]|nr:class I SAM-dependent methyltransferase [Thermodesulfobacteriota bacterium]
MKEKNAYMMENEQEAKRLDIKTDDDAVRSQALWCGIGPGMRVLDVGCGSGHTTAVLHSLTGPEGETVGIDFSEDRLAYAREHFGREKGIKFVCADFTRSMADLGEFDVIWVKFVLEYFLDGCRGIVENLTSHLKPDGVLCLLDLDYNCLSHYQLPEGMDEVLRAGMTKMMQAFNFDPFVGRKLYSFLYDLGYRSIELDLRAHHLIYGPLNEVDAFNWTKKVEMACVNAPDLFDPYPGGYEAFLSDFKTFARDPRRFTYTPLIMCQGKRPQENHSG